jgi:hypothetical protein
VSPGGDAARQPHGPGLHESDRTQTCAPVQAECPPGTLPVGGAFSVDSQELRVQASEPYSETTGGKAGWQVSALNLDAESAHGLVVQAICLQVGASQPAGGSEH